MMKPFFSRQLQSFVVDEMCECGHSKSEHGSKLRKLPGNRFIRLVEEGNCCNMICSCSQFTWKGWVIADKAANLIIKKRDKKSA